MLPLDTIRAGIYGHAIGDALGVPVEFESREALAANPVVDMRPSDDLPAGTWSDDTSMTLALLESLARLGRIDYADIMDNFGRWVNEAAFTATGELFDIGRGTRQAVMKHFDGIPPVECGGRSDNDNGNGSLMRIAPLTLYLYAKQGEALSEDAMAAVHDVSALTHGHARSKMACGIYTLLAVRLLAGRKIYGAVVSAMEAAKAFYRGREEYAPEMETYRRLWEPDFATLPEDAIASSGYVVDTLEAALWCLLNTSDYEACVLKAVNLGEDTDTVAAVAGGLAGAAYGWEAIPRKWLAALQNGAEIEKLCAAFGEMLAQEA